jgi:hypothetical protein
VKFCLYHQCIKLFYPMDGGMGFLRYVGTCVHDPSQQTLSLKTQLPLLCDRCCRVTRRSQSYRPHLPRCIMGLSLPVRTAVCSRVFRSYVCPLYDVIWLRLFKAEAKTVDSFLTRHASYIHFYFPCVIRGAELSSFVRDMAALLVSVAICSS